ncbi:MAG: FGGY family carbohydrate kinase [Anaerolineae bacterium]
MTGSRLMLAVDIGTSGARAVLFDARAQHLAQARRGYDTSFPQPGWSEQNPNAVAEAVIEALREVVAAADAGRSLAGIVVSAQMYSILALDRTGAPLSNTLTWGDTRSATLADDARRSASEALFLRTGCPIQAIYPLAKIRWLKANLDLPDDMRFGSIKDFVLLRLTDEFVTDWSTASASGLLNVARHVWDDEALALGGISAANLPELLSPRHVLRRWRSDVAAHIGIPDDTPLIMGAGDAPLANIGVGAVGAGTLAINIGTSAAARVLTSHPQADAAGQLWTYVADEDHWVTAIIGSGGAAYEWLLKRLLLAHRHAPVDELFRKSTGWRRPSRRSRVGCRSSRICPGSRKSRWKTRKRKGLACMTFQHDTDTSSALPSKGWRSRCCGWQTPSRTARLRRPDRI